MLVTGVHTTGDRVTEDWLTGWFTEYGECHWINFVTEWIIIVVVWEFLELYPELRVLEFSEQVTPEKGNNNNIHCGIEYNVKVLILLIHSPACGWLLLNLPICTGQIYPICWINILCELLSDGPCESARSRRWVRKRAVDLLLLTPSCWSKRRQRPPSD